MSSRKNLLALMAAGALMSFSVGCSHQHGDEHAAAEALRPVSLSLSQGDAAGNILLASHPMPSEAVTSTADQFDEVD